MLNAFFMALIAVCVLLWGWLLARLILFVVNLVIS